MTSARNRLWPTVLVAALVIAVVSLTAVAPRLLAHDRGHRGGNNALASDGYPATFDGSLGASVHLVGSGVNLSPPPAGALATTAISWQQALNTCQTSGSLCYPDLTAHVYLAEFTEENTQPTPRLSWIIDYPAAQCVPLGNPPAQSSSPPSARPSLRYYACRVINIIDPQTGALLWSLRVAPS